MKNVIRNLTVFMALVWIQQSLIAQTYTAKMVSLPYPPAGITSSFLDKMSNDYAAFISFGTGYGNTLFTLDGEDFDTLSYHRNGSTTSNFRLGMEGEYGYLCSTKDSGTSGNNANMGLMSVSFDQNTIAVNYSNPRMIGISQPVWFNNKVYVIGSYITDPNNQSTTYGRIAEFTNNNFQAVSGSGVHGPQGSSNYLNTTNLFVFKNKLAYVDFSGKVWYNLNSISGLAGGVSLTGAQIMGTFPYNNTDTMLLVIGNSAANGKELFVDKGNGLQLIRDLAPGSQWSEPLRNPTYFRGWVYFTNTEMDSLAPNSYYYTTKGPALYRTDGNTIEYAGGPINGKNGYTVIQTVVTPNHLYAILKVGTAYHLYRTDGVGQLVKLNNLFDINIGSNYSQHRYMAYHDGKLWISGKLKSTNKRGIISINDNPAIDLLTMEVERGSLDEPANGLLAYRNKLYFCDNNGSSLQRYLYVLKQSTSTNLEDVSTANLKFFPNPSTNELNVVIPEEKLPFELRVTNLLGQNVLRQTAVSEHAIIDVSALPRGLYFLNNSRFIKE